MEATSRPFLDDVYLENSAITNALRSRKATNRPLLTETIKAAQTVLGDHPHVDVVAVTSQTGFDFYGPLSYFIRMRLAEAGITFDEMEERQSFSNSQPFIGDIAERVDREGIRALILALEPLNLWPKSERTSRLRQHVLDRPEREHLPSMMHGLNELIEAFCARFDISPSALAELKQQLTLTLYSHKAGNPYSQYRSSLTSSDYSLAQPFTGQLAKWDCCPTTTQGAALVLSPYDRLVTPDSAVRFRATTTHKDPRSLEERFAFNHYPHDEALHHASAELLDHPLMGQLGITRAQFLDRGILELHNAMSPLVILLLIEMGFIQPEEAVQLFDRIDMNRINPSGGLFAGHPLAATFPVIAHHSRLQLLNKAPAGLQLPHVDHALIQSIYGLRDRLSLTLLSRE